MNKDPKVENYERVCLTIGEHLNELWKRFMDDIINEKQSLKEVNGKALSSAEIIGFAEMLNSSVLSVSFGSNVVKGPFEKCWGSDLQFSKAEKGSKAIEGSISIGVGIKF